MAQAVRTIDHEEIREWIEARGGMPAVVEGTNDGEGSGILRIDWGDNAEAEQLDEVGWEEFFRIFDENNLAFLYQEETSEGPESYACRFVARDEEMQDQAELEMGEDDDLQAL